ncbi:hypothetical protein Ae201684P_013349 [Aphanomyces euteiches]|uniref:Uncharacterized protein n=1 Tax=Aphanomyces euteiches TaxID=100861 RepID=A0A6G0WSB5_9STRA|nr:hypothetical protein Ae201684_012315 [Aphanomyces euteiches]KAH9096683.1 hypothetical protein Ae201684P_013349 [Aphanomyces euteiches]
MKGVNDGEVPKDTLPPHYDTLHKGNDGWNKVDGDCECVVAFQSSVCTPDCPMQCFPRHILLPTTTATYCKYCKLCSRAKSEAALSGVLSCKRRTDCSDTVAPCMDGGEETVNCSTLHTCSRCVT